MKAALDKAQMIQIICAQITAAGTIAAAHVEGVEVNQDLLKKNFQRALSVVAEVTDSYSLQKIG